MLLSSSFRWKRETRKGSPPPVLRVQKKDGEKGTFSQLTKNAKKKEKNQRAADKSSMAHATI